MKRDWSKIILRDKPTVDNYRVKLGECMEALVVKDTVKDVYTQMHHVLSGKLV